MKKLTITLDGDNAILAAEGGVSLGDTLTFHRYLTAAVLSELRRAATNEPALIEAFQAYLLDLVAHAPEPEFVCSSDDPAPVRH